MQPIFQDDFSSVELYNWKTEQHVPDGYPDFLIRNQALVMLDAGNRILPLIPKLKTFSIKGGFEPDWACNGDKFSLQIYFSYDQHTRQGMSLDIKSDGKELSTSLSCAGKLLIKEKIDQRIFENIIRNQIVNFEAKVNDGGISLFLNSEKCFSHAIDNKAGVIALSRGAFTGELRLKSLEIATEDQLQWQTIWDRLAIPFAPINGMDNPITWTVSARQLGNITQLDVELSGGVKDREHLDWFRYHCHYLEHLQAPYLRVESPRQSNELTLTQKTLTLCNPLSKYFYMLGFENPQWPYKKRFYIENMDVENTVLICGYKSYREKPNKHQAAEQSETLYDCKSGKIIYFGQAIEPGTVVFDLKSSHDKQICRDIPKTAHEYKKALHFAQENHYFSDNEECCFHLELFSRMGKATAELCVKYRLENAFFEPLSEYQSVRLEEASETIALNIEKLRSQKITFNKLNAGVYHVSFRLYQGRELLQKKHRAFEVMSKGISGPQASGLPKLFCSSTETMGIDTDYFDPWKPDCVDVSHYISICVQVMPHFAMEKRLWELYKLYGREWFLWLTSRTAEDWTLSKHRDLVEHCDYMLMPNTLGEVSLHRLCGRAFYSGPVLDVFHDFALANDFHPQKIKKLIDENAIPDMDTFNELLGKYFYQWVDFFCEQFAKTRQQNVNEVASISDHVKFSDYGPVALYAAAYKTVHSTRYVAGLRHSREIEDIYNGFFVLEDYPHTCRYSIHRGPFLLAGLQMIYPKLKIYPEMYSPTGEPCPDAAVARPWPSVGIWKETDLAVGCSVKVAMEYVYAAVCHDGENFRYWHHYGFHTALWERERYEALLRAWGFIDKVKAARPLKANAFICNEVCCENHAVYYDEYPGDGHGHAAYGDMFNTAEESIAYAYEMSRCAGQNAGFVADFNSLAKLGAQDIDTLIIPPLTKISREDLADIRRLHEQGVSLLAFEEVAGLEDLFGVVQGEEKQVHHISVNRKSNNNPLMNLVDITEYSEHRACKGKYRSDGADVLLEGEVPVLFTHQTRWGKTALFNVPPTVVRREDQFHRVAYGRDSISQLINLSTQLVLKYLSKPVVDTDAGKIIAFRDTKDITHIVVEEDAHPFPASAIKPLLTINLPGLRPDKISCNKEFSIVAISENFAKLRLTLMPNEFAIISIAN